MNKCLSIAFIGNLIDAFATYVLYSKFGFIELNLMMVFLLQWPLLFLIVKILLGSGIVYYLAIQKNRDKYWKIAAGTAAAVYGALGLYYIIWFLLILL